MSIRVETAGINMHPYSYNWIEILEARIRHMEQICILGSVKVGFESFNAT